MMKARFGEAIELNKEDVQNLHNKAVQRAMTADELAVLIEGVSKEVAIAGIEEAIIKGGYTYSELVKLHSMVNTLMWAAWYKENGND